MRPFEDTINPAIEAAAANRPGSLLDLFKLFFEIIGSIYKFWAGAVRGLSPAQFYEGACCAGRLTAISLSVFRHPERITLAQIKKFAKATRSLRRLLDWNVDFSPLDILDPQDSPSPSNSIQSTSSTSSTSSTTSIPSIPSTPSIPSISSAPNPQSSNPQSSIRNPQSAIPNPHSAFRIPRFLESRAPGAALASVIRRMTRLFKETAHLLPPLYATFPNPPASETANPESENPQSENPQSENPQSENPHSTIPNPQSAISSLRAPP